MRAIQIPHAGGPFELVELPTPTPGPGEARIAVQACGVCHSDQTAKDGLMAGMTYPLIPGHEVTGVIDALGEGVTGWRVGQRVGVGWFGGQCGHCPRCRRGEFMTCQRRDIPGVTRDGGYAEAMVVSAGALALIPDALSAVEAAPMLCAGITTYNALLRSGARGGDLVAIQGVGGLGHLGIQFAARLGYRTVAIARGRQKEALARQLGAIHYIDSAEGDVAGQLNSLGGARVILSTVTDAAAMSDVIGGLTVDGVMMVVGVPAEPIAVPPWMLISGRSVRGSAGGTAVESEDAMAFSALTGVRPLIETMPLERAAEAYDRMMRGDARFRMVLTTGL
jgi:D-arabinose 1-dehydrogenase-like Zn-dependent alcohol dehydrogenase